MNTRLLVVYAIMAKFDTQMRRPSTLDPSTDSNPMYLEAAALGLISEVLDSVRPRASTDGEKQKLHVRNVQDKAKEISLYLYTTLKKDEREKLFPLPFVLDSSAEKIALSKVHLQFLRWISGALESANEEDLVLPFARVPSRQVVADSHVRALIPLLNIFPISEDTAAVYARFVPFMQGASPSLLSVEERSALREQFATHGVCTRDVFGV